MNSFSNGLWRMGNYVTSMRITDVIDILIVTYLIYKTIDLFRKTNSRNLAKALFVFLAVLGLSELLNLSMINFVLRKAMEIGLIALVILFQPELRRVLERIGASFSTSGKLAESVSESIIKQTVLACSDMSRAKTGALIIFERGMSLSEIIATGTVIDADVNAELLKNLFYDKAPLHDGAVIIRKGRIAAAGCVLPLTKSTNLSKELGMRHRAGLGLSEQSDALVLIVSEETGAISCAIEGMLKRHLDPRSVDKLLRAELKQDEEEKKLTLSALINRAFGQERKEEGNDEKTL